MNFWELDQTINEGWMKNLALASAIGAAGLGAGKMMPQQDSGMQSVIQALDASPKNRWNDRLGYFSAHRGEDGTMYVKSQVGNIYKIDKGFDGRQVYLKYDQQTGNWERVHITDYMRAGGGGWKQVR